MTTFISATQVRSIAVLALLAAILLAPIAASAAVLTRQLQLGMTGSDVATLQSFLAEDNTIYPQGLVTGYFGFLTKAAVSNFQVRNGIDNVGRVGPITLAAINAQMAGTLPPSMGDVTVPILSAVNVNTATNSANISWSTNEPTVGVVYYNGSWMSESEGKNVVIGGTPARTDTALRTAHNVTVSGLLPNTVYYYDVYVTDAAGNSSMTMQTTFKTTN